MLIDLATASPPYKVDQTLAAEELKQRMKGDSSLSRIVDIAARYSGINTRYIVVPDAETEPNSVAGFFTDKNGNYINPDTKSRMDLYEEWSIKLTTEAVDNLLIKSKINPQDIKRIITISCTGFFAPGLDYQLINRFNLPKDIKRTHIGFMGCAAALIGVNSVWESLSQQDNLDSFTLLVAVEICSIHLQTEASRDNILANMIFADGAGAGLFTNKNIFSDRPRMKIVFAKSILFENSSEFMGWKIGNFGFEMMLSSELPKIILSTAAPEVIRMLESANVNLSDIKFWALHPGGRSILDSLQKGLKLSDEKLQLSREVLQDYGNMSSASILFVLNKILYSPLLKKNDLCCAIAFGPGLTMELVLFKVI